MSFVRASLSRRLSACVTFVCVRALSFSLAAPFRFVDKFFISDAQFFVPCFFIFAGPRVSLLGVAEPMSFVRVSLSRRLSACVTFVCARALSFSLAAPFSFRLSFFIC
jgi:hypothetical protein